MSDSTTNLDQISVSQSQKEVTANQDFASAWTAFSFGRRDSTSAALTWAYYGGNWYPTGSPSTMIRVADGTIALTASATNYLYLSGAGVVTKVTSAPTGWPGPLANGDAALYTVITNGSGIDPAAWPAGGFRDHRIIQGSSGSAGPAGAPGAPGTAPTTITTNAQSGTTYTLVLTDAGKCVEMNNAAQNLLTIPPNSSVAFATDTVILVRQQGAGTTTIVGGAGVTLRSSSLSGSPSSVNIRVQYGTVNLHKRATDEWCVDGNLA